MKRSREVTILVNSLVESGLLEQKSIDRARCVINESIKEIRRERYKEKQTKNCDENDNKIYPLL